jgi:hypothetical protein
MHLSGSLPEIGTKVSTSTTLGYVSHTGLGSSGADHLHFAAYIGTFADGTNASTCNKNGCLASFNPATLGGSFAKFDYSPYVWKRFVDDKSSSDQFVVGGATTDVTSSSKYGIGGSMKYTQNDTSTSSNRNTFDFKLPAKIPTTGKYYIWPWIPRNYGTTSSAPYKIFAGTSTSTSLQSNIFNFNVNQVSISDQYYRSSSVSLSAENYVTVRLSDVTGESTRSTYVAADQVLLWRKTDHCLGSYCSSLSATNCGAFCVQEYATSTYSSNCECSSTIPKGY